MGRAHTFSTTAPDTQRKSVMFAFARGAEVVIASVGLILAGPLLGLLALAVRRSSHGPVLHREPALDRQGRPVELLSFRTSVDGAGTTHHARLRAVVGRGSHESLTGIGRVMRATRTDRLPRLVNVVAGHAHLLAG